VSAADSVFGFTRTPESAVAYEQAHTREAEAIAGGVEQAVAELEVGVALTGDTVVPGAEVAVQYAERLGPLGVDTIVPGLDLQLFEDGVPAVEDTEGIVGGTHDGEIFNADTFAVLQPRSRAGNRKCS